jgi:hypothetical protein
MKIPPRNLEGMTEEARQEVAQFVLDLKALTLQPSPPRHLFHYTSAHGLLGIIESGKLWASPIQYMNDSSELNHANRIFMEVLRELVKSNHPGAKQFDKVKTGPLRDKIDNYAFSLSEYPDQLSQWRAYTRNGDGYAIGFDTNHLIDNEYFEIRKIVYDEDKQREIVSGFFDIMRKFSDGDVFTRTVIYALISEDVLLTFKNHAFKEEQEWRLMAPLTPKFSRKFRVTHGHLIPYVEFAPKSSNGSEKNDILPISCIVQGPQVTPSLGENALRSLLETHGYSKNIEIRRSSVPLR